MRAYASVIRVPAIGPGAAPFVAFAGGAAERGVVTLETVCVLMVQAPLRCGLFHRSTRRTPAHSTRRLRLRELPGAAQDLGVRPVQAHHRSALENELAPDPEHHRSVRAAGKRANDLHVSAQLEASGDHPVVEELSAILVLRVQQ